MKTLQYTTISVPMEESLRGEIRSAKMARALCRSSALLESAVDEEVLYKRLQFLIYELRNHCAAQTSPLATLDNLVEFFFHQKGYSAVSPENHFSEDHLVSTLITTRKADIEVLTMLFCLMAEEMGLSLQILALRPLRYVRLASSEVVLDMAEEGCPLSAQDLIEVLQEHPRLNHGEQDHLDHFQLLVSYLTHLKDCSPCLEDPHLSLALQNQLIELCPQQISLFGERALIYRQLGQTTHAHADLKRYFSFRDKESGPAELVDLLTELEFQLASVPAPL